MPEIVLEVPITATPHQVYAAIAEQQGLSSWWTPDVVARPEVGSVWRFTFAGGYVVKMEVTALEPQRRVQWLVTDGAPEWVGTRVKWELSAVGNRTNGRFSQSDYASTQGTFAYTAWNWAWYLASLKTVPETGTGRPGQLPL